MMKGYIPAALAATLLLTNPVLAEEQKSAPITMEAAAALASNPIKGKVLDVQSAGGYTYLLIKHEQGEIWVALPESKAETGQEVTVGPGMMMKAFESKALGKTFNIIIFSSGLIDEAHMAAATTNPHAARAAHDVHGAEEAEKEVSEAELEKLSGGSARAVVIPADEIKVKKADGKNAQTVEECFAKADQLNNKTVQVRGKVMKFSPMIMGKNWIHLQDGTGDPAQKTHDLVVTTSGETKKGAVITIEGILHKDKDFGAGYRYAAIIEEAKVLE
ncbi:MAG: DNA-binding protein [Candidatus Electrothrix sp. MAN1_4]|nr:DNA-binding protein [Candidatus Electrothrix sp. MAN1_4]